MKTLKNRPKKLLIIGPNLFFHSPVQSTDQSPGLIFHIINTSQDTSVLLSVTINSILHLTQRIIFPEVNVMFATPTAMMNVLSNKKLTFL